MYLVFEHSFEGTSLVLITRDPMLTEDMVVKKFKEIADPGDELVMLIIDSIPTYAVRRKISDVPEDDGFEYVDNEGNAIHADGTDILDTDEADTIKQELYEFPGDFYWTVNEAELDEERHIDNDIYQTLSMESNSPFEDEDEIAIVTTA